ncbi:hypothetical protein [Streptomyces sp. NPDC058451]|uniref:hypothetical protein n=1 Tax=Streptomyces sp. NPDC058451 TaxID=3346506 RepID=UPI0036698A13
MSANDIFAVIASWASEDSRRGEHARKFLSNDGNDPKLQAKRFGMLSMYFDREAARIARRRLAAV